MCKTSLLAFIQYPDGYLEAQAKKEEETGEVTKKGKRKRDDNG